MCGIRPGLWARGARAPRARALRGFMLTGLLLCAPASVGAETTAPPSASFTEEDPSPSAIALAAVEVVEGLEDPDPLATRVENAIFASLQSSGLRALSSSEFDPAWRASVREAGGYYDAVSGRPDLAKRRALRAAVLRELHQRRGARLLLQARLVAVRADFQRGKAAWDGASETAAPSGSGEVPALTLVIQLEDLTGREIDSARAGIQLLGKYSMWNNKYVVVPREKLLADEERLRDAVGRALGALLETMRASPTGEASAPTDEASAPTDEASVPGVEAVERVEPRTGIEAPPAGARVLALRALVVPDAPITVPGGVETRYLGYLRTRLEDAGWWVLPPEAFEGTFRRVALERGGVFDPLTGEGDPDALAAALRDTRARLAEQYRAGAFVTAGIFIRYAGFHGEKASWDGVSEDVADIARWKKLLVSTRGRTRALSFGVGIEGADGALLHTGWGGIQLLDRLEHDRFVHLAADELFADPERDRRAVDLALEGWAD